MPIVRTYLPSAAAIGNAAFTAGQGEYEKQRAKFGLDVAQFGEQQRQFDIQNAMRNQQLNLQADVQRQRLFQDALQNQQMMDFRMAQEALRNQQVYDRLGAEYDRMENMAGIANSRNQAMQSRLDQSQQFQWDMNRQNKMFDAAKVQQGQQFDAESKGFEAASKSYLDMLGQAEEDLQGFTPEAQAKIREFRKDFNAIALGIGDGNQEAAKWPISWRKGPLMELSRATAAFLQDPANRVQVPGPEEAVRTITGPDGKPMTMIDKDSQWQPYEPKTEKPAAPPVTADNLVRLRKEYIEQQEKALEAKFEKERADAQKIADQTKRVARMAEIDKSEIEAKAGIQPTDEQLGVYYREKQAAAERATAAATGQPAPQKPLEAQQLPYDPSQPPQAQQLPHDPSQPLEAEPLQVPEEPKPAAEAQAPDGVNDPIQIEWHPDPAVREAAIKNLPEGARAVIVTPGGDEYPVEVPPKREAPPARPVPKTPEQMLQDLSTTPLEGAALAKQRNEYLDTIRSQVPLKFRNHTLNERFKSWANSLPHDQFVKYTDMLKGDKTMHEVIRQIQQDAENGMIDTTWGDVYAATRQTGKRTARAVYRGMDKVVSTGEQAIDELRQGIPRAIEDVMNSGGTYTPTMDPSYTGRSPDTNVEVDVPESLQELGNQVADSVGYAAMTAKNIGERMNTPSFVKVAGMNAYPVDAPEDLDMGQEYIGSPSQPIPWDQATRPLILEAMKAATGSKIYVIDRNGQLLAIPVPSEMGYNYANWHSR